MNEQSFNLVKAVDFLDTSTCISISNNIYERIVTFLRFQRSFSKKKKFIHP